MNDIESLLGGISAAEPPAPPRKAAFPKTSARAHTRDPRFLPRAVFNFFQWLPAALCGSFVYCSLFLGSGRTTTDILKLKIWVLPICLLIPLSFVGSMWWLKRRVRWEQYMYVNGIATMVTRKKHRIEWKTDSGVVHRGTSYRLSYAVGERYWVLYDPANANRIIRWTRFAENGQLKEKEKRARANKARKSQETYKHSACYNEIA